MTTLDEQIKILQAAKDGKIIERRRKLSRDGWAVKNLVISPSFNFHAFEYRVKPEPRTIYVAFNDSGKAYAAALETDAIRDPWWNERPVSRFVEQL